MKIYDALGFIIFLYREIQLFSAIIFLWFDPESDEISLIN